MTRVFVSSTVADLSDHRKSVLETIDRLRIQGLPVEWVGIEAFPSRDKSSINACLEYVDQADLYVGILGESYGSIDPSSGMSITELEYRRARDRNIPLLLFLSKAETSETKELDSKLETLRNEWKKERLLNFFSSPGELAMQVSIALFPFLAYSDIQKLRDISEAAKGLRGRIGSYQKSLAKEFVVVAQVIDTGAKSILVLGEAGSGKSTFARYLYESLAEGDSTKGMDIFHLPVGSYIVNDYEELKRRLDVRCSLLDLLKGISQRQGLVLILDGIDETSFHEKSASFWSGLVLLISQWEHSCVVVTCREEDFKNCFEMAALRRMAWNTTLHVTPWTQMEVREALVQNNMPIPSDTTLELLRNPFLLDLYAQVCLRSKDVSGLRNELDLYECYWNLMVSGKKPPSTSKEMLAAAHWLTNMLMEAKSLVVDEDQFRIEHPSGLEGLARNSVILRDGSRVRFRHSLLLDYAMIRMNQWLIDFVALRELLSVGKYEPFFRSSLSMFIRFLIALERFDEIQALLTATFQNDSTGWALISVDYISRCPWSKNLSEVLHATFFSLSKDKRQMALVRLVRSISSINAEWVRELQTWPEGWIAEEEGVTLHQAVADALENILANTRNDELNKLILETGKKFEAVARRRNLDLQKVGRDWTDWPSMRFLQVLCKSKNQDLVTWIYHLVAETDWYRVKMMAIEHLAWISESDPAVAVAVAELCTSPLRLPAAHDTNLHFLSELLPELVDKHPRQFIPFTINLIVKLWEAQNRTQREFGHPIEDGSYMWYWASQHHRNHAKLCKIIHDRLSDWAANGNTEKLVISIPFLSKGLIAVLPAILLSVLRRNPSRWHRELRDMALDEGLYHAMSCIYELQETTKAICSYLTESEILRWAEIIEKAFPRDAGDWRETTRIEFFSCLEGRLPQGMAQELQLARAKGVCIAIAPICSIPSFEWTEGNHSREVDKDSSPRLTELYSKSLNSPLSTEDAKTANQMLEKVFSEELISESLADALGLAAHLIRDKLANEETINLAKLFAGAVLSQPVPLNYDENPDSEDHDIPVDVFSHSISTAMHLALREPTEENLDRCFDLLMNPNGKVRWLALHNLRIPLDGRKERYFSFLAARIKEEHLFCCLSLICRHVLSLLRYRNGRDFAVEVIESLLNRLRNCETDTDAKTDSIIEMIVEHFGIWLPIEDCPEKIDAWVEQCAEGKLGEKAILSCTFGVKVKLEHLMRRKVDRIRWQKVESCYLKVIERLNAEDLTTAALWMTHPLEEIHSPEAFQRLFPVLTALALKSTTGMHYAFVDHLRAYYSDFPVQCLEVLDIATKDGRPIRIGSGDGIDEFARALKDLGRYLGSRAEKERLVQCLERLAGYPWNNKTAQDYLLEI